jgi:hypothetical protein
MLRFSKAFCGAVLSFFFVYGIHAQVNTADVVGTVTDASGGAVANADVTITDAGTGVSRTTKTSASGEYAFTALQVGTYAVNVKAVGFADFQAQNLKLAAGDRARVDAKLAVGQQTQTVEVSAAAAALQTDSSSIGGLITDHAVQNFAPERAKFRQPGAIVGGSDGGLA